MNILEATLAAQERGDRPMAIWKFKLEKFGGIQFVEMPGGSVPLSVGVEYQQSFSKGPGKVYNLQDFDICLWAMVDPNEDKVRRMIILAETGQLYKADTRFARFIGAVHLQAIGGPYVAHAFDGMTEMTLVGYEKNKVEIMAEANRTLRVTGDKG